MSRMIQEKIKRDLASLCEYRKGKVSVEQLNKNTYISTENMLPNKGGVTSATSLPNISLAQEFRKHDILVSNIRPYFKKIWKAEYDGGCSNDVLVFRAKDDCDPTFLFYLLADDNFFNYATATAKGTKMPRGDKSAIMQYSVLVFDIDTQKKIGALLWSIDQKVRLNNQINENLEQQAKAYFQELFIENADPNWKLGTISDLGTVVGGSTPSKSKPEYYTEKGIAWITPKDLSVNKYKFVSRGENDITELGLKNSSASIMPEGTVLFSSRAPIGYIAIAAGEVTTNQGFKSVVPKPEIGTAFVYFFLKQNLSLIEGMASGSTFKEVSGSTMKSIPATVPAADTISKFNDFCTPIFTQQRILEEQNQSLTELRNSLLPKLMAGEIDLSEVQF